MRKMPKNGSIFANSDEHLGHLGHLGQLAQLGHLGHLGQHQSWQSRNRKLFHNRYAALQI